MRFDLDDLPPELETFVAQRRVATLTLVRADGTPHVTPVGITWDSSARLVRVITWADALKARILSKAGSVPAAACEVDGGHWLTFSGSARLVTEAGPVDEAVERYTRRYKPPKPRSDRVAIELQVASITGRL
jgi:PPOX class probable F420-dependent enzyme